MMKIRASNYKGEGANPLIVEVTRQGKLSSPENFGAESLQLLGPAWVGLKFDKTNLAHAKASSSENYTDSIGIYTGVYGSTRIPSKDKEKQVKEIVRCGMMPILGNLGKPLRKSPPRSWSLVRGLAARLKQARARVGSQCATRRGRGCPVTVVITNVWMKG